MMLERRKTMAKVVYTSKYKDEMVELQGVTVIVQFIDDEDKQNQIDKINEILSRRLAVSNDMRLTKFFETRAKNMLLNLYASKSAAEMLEVVLKSANVSMSGYYRYRDVYDMVKEKSEQFDMNNIESEIVDLVLTSLEKNHVIAPKISAIYKKLAGTDSDDDLI
jgi:uncharacterized protein YfkK (UPF0435 family)